MRQFTALIIYQLLLPLLFLAAFPGWIIKMLRRGGLGTQIGERAGIYSTLLESEPCGAVASAAAHSTTTKIQAIATMYMSTPWCT